MNIIFLFFLFILVHLAVLHLVGRSALIVRSFFLALFFALFLMVKEQYFDALVFCAFWVMYMVVLISSTNSLTLRMLDELSRFEKERVPESFLESKFPREESFLSRIRMMEKSGWIQTAAGRYVLTPQGRVMGGGISLLRKLFGYPSEK